MHVPCTTVLIHLEPKYATHLILILDGSVTPKPLMQTPLRFQIGSELADLGCAWDLIMGTQVSICEKLSFNPLHGKTQRKTACRGAMKEYLFWNIKLQTNSWSQNAVLLWKVMMQKWPPLVQLVCSLFLFGLKSSNCTVIFFSCLFLLAPFSTQLWESELDSILDHLSTTRTVFKSTMFKDNEVAHM